MSSTQLKVYYLLLSKREELDSSTSPKLTQTSSADIDEVFNSITSGLSLSKKSNPNRFHVQTGKEPRWILLNTDDEDIPSNSEFIYGLFVKSRSAKWPYQEDTDGTVSQLKSIKAMAEITYFVVDKSKGVVIFAANQFVGGHKALQVYLNVKIQELRNSMKTIILKNGKKSFLFEMNMIINEIGLDEIFKKGKIVKYSMRVVRPKFYDTSKKDISLKNETDVFVNNLKWVKTQNIDFSAGRSNELPKSRVKKWISFARENRQIVRKAEVIDENSRVINMLEEEYILTSVIEYNKRYMPYKDVFDLMISEYKSKLDVIAECIKID